MRMERKGCIRLMAQLLGMLIFFSSVVKFYTFFPVWHGREETPEAVYRSVMSELDGRHSISSIHTSDLF